MPPYADQVYAAATRHTVPANLVFAVIEAESGFISGRVSSEGAIGLMQIMPGTARGLGIDPWNDAENIDGGTRYLKQQYGTFGTWQLALAAYNAGPKNVQDYGGVPPFAETQAYVDKVLRRWSAYDRELGTTTPAPADARSDTDSSPDGGSTVLLFAFLIGAAMFLDAVG